MGKELEYKLWVPSESALVEILSDREIVRLTASPWQCTQMKTTYFDTADRSLSAQKWMLRHRMEGAQSVVCLKTPMDEAHVRGEWEIEAQTVNPDTIAQLLAVGAPPELRTLCSGHELLPICGALFRRRSVMLTFPDGSRAELAGDHGILHGALATLPSIESFLDQNTPWDNLPTSAALLPFTELELELSSGRPEEMCALASTLCARYALHEEPRSKASRAFALK